MPVGDRCGILRHGGGSDLSRGDGVSVKLHSVGDEEEAGTAEHTKLHEFFGSDGGKGDLLSEEPDGLRERQGVGQWLPG